ncbi:MAG: PD-(D/E)XK nuclease family protein, partial [Solirubrobacterales bacterium]
AREGLAVGFSPASIAVTVHEPSAELVRDLGTDLRRADDAAAAPASGAKPPMLIGARRAGSAARSLSYAALAAYERCGYRFMVERVIGLGGERSASAPGSTASPAAAPEAADPTGSRFGLGRAVHELLERSARARWQAPSDEEIAAALLEHSLPPDRHGRVKGVVAGWLASPLLAELRDAGARMRPEVPFRIALGRDSIIRGTIDLLAEVPGRPPLVIDYKTDSNPPGLDAGLGEAYRLQRSLYALAISQTTGAQEVESAYVFLATPEQPIRATVSAEEIAAGREGLERLCGAIDERRFEATDSPHAALCHDCPARARLCPYPRELTLRPAA